VWAMDPVPTGADSRDMTVKSMLCHVGVHSWEDRLNDDGEPYLECRRCGKEGDKIHLSDYGDTGGGSMG